MAWNQLRCENLPKSSWFRQLKDLHEKYRLPHPVETLQNKPTKNEWKSIVSKAIRNYWVPAIQADLTEKSSVYLLAKYDFTPGKAHRLWTDTNYDKRYIRRSCIKSKLLTGTYILQQNRARFNQFAVDPTCLMCGDAPETISHFLLHCKALTEARNYYLEKSLHHFPEPLRGHYSRDDQLMVQIIMNCPDSILWGNEIINTKQLASKTEPLSRGLCYALHCRRAALLCYRP